FVFLDQARSLGTAAFLSTLTSTKTQAWVSAPGQITVPEGVPGFPVTATLNATGLNLSRARVVWEALGQDPVYDGAAYTFVPTNQGTYWIEAEAQLPDGRRAFAVSNFLVTNRPPTVTVTAPDPNAGR